MAQWRLQITFTPGIGVYVTITRQEIFIAIPFITCYIGLGKAANGFEIFGHIRRR